MKYINTFESNRTDDILIIVDVQKSFKKYFTDNYVKELKKYCNEFDEVFQIWDNHINGKVGNEYLFDHDPEINIGQDLYHFPNQTEIIEKRYNYDVSVDYYKKILDKNTYDNIKKKESNDKLIKGEMFKTTKGTAIVYIGNNHKWFQIPKKLYKRLSNDKYRRYVIVGGSDTECLEDVYISSKSIGVDISRNKGYIYSGKNCPIK
jgi:hypothetical protein